MKLYKKKIIPIIILLIISIILISAYFADLYKKSDSIGIFEAPVSGEVTFSFSHGRTISLTDRKERSEFIELCKEGVNYIATDDKNTGSPSFSVWIDFHNGRDVLGILEDGAFGSLHNEESDVINVSISEEVNNYINSLLKNN